MRLRLRLPRKKAALFGFNNGGTSSARQLLDSSPLYAQLTKSLVLNRGTGSATFTRATTAVFRDYEGIQRTVPAGCARFQGGRMVRNLLTSTENFSVAAWQDATPNLPTVTVNAAVAPNGTTTADLLTAATGGTNCAARQAVTAAGSSVFNVSVYLKAGTSTRTRILVRDNTNGTNFIQATQIDWSGGVPTVGGVTAGTFQSESVGSGWYRISAYGTSGAGSSISLLFSIFPDASLGTGTVYVWGAQLQNVSGASTQTVHEYVSVGVLSAPYHGAGVDGVKFYDTTLAGAPIPASTLLGYLAEGARTNRCLYSQDFSNAVWVSGGGGITVATNSIAAPDGTTTADTLTAAGANGTLIQDLGVVASAAKAGGLWLKRKTGTGNIDLTLDGGSTWTTVAVTSTWTRFEKTQTLADEDFGIRIVTSGDAVYAWQGQVETASFLSSDIATTTAAATRNADVLTFPSSGNVDGTVGWCYAEFTYPHSVPVGTSPRLLNTDVAGLSVPLYLGNTSGALRLYDGTSDRDGGTPTYPVNTPTKAGSTWGGSTSIIGLSGSVVSRGFDGDLNVGATIQIGCISGTAGFALNGTIRNVRIGQRQLSASELQAITQS